MRENCIKTIMSRKSDSLVSKRNIARNCRRTKNKWHWKGRTTITTNCSKAHNKKHENQYFQSLMLLPSTFALSAAVNTALLSVIYKDYTKHSWSTSVIPKLFSDRNEDRIFYFLTYNSKCVTQTQRNADGLSSIPISAS